MRNCFRCASKAAICKTSRAAAELRISVFVRRACLELRITPGKEAKLFEWMQTEALETAEVEGKIAKGDKGV